MDVSLECSRVHLIGFMHAFAILNPKRGKACKHWTWDNMAHCCVPDCSNDWRYKTRYFNETGKLLRFHKFNDKNKKDWLRAIRRDEGPLFTVSV
jgi:hypothetical protein